MSVTAVAHVQLLITILKQTSLILGLADRTFLPPGSLFTLATKAGCQQLDKHCELLDMFLLFKRRQPCFLKSCSLVQVHRKQTWQLTYLHHKILGSGLAHKPAVHHSKFQAQVLLRHHTTIGKRMAASWLHE